MRRAAWLGGTPETSPKLQKLLDICEEAYENGHKVLVFSFFRDVIRTVESHLDGRTFDPIIGDVPNHRRQDIIDEFTNADPGAVLISQITAGGVGFRRPISSFYANRSGSLRLKNKRSAVHIEWTSHGMWSFIDYLLRIVSM